jgi:hypothetical protein
MSREHTSFSLVYGSFDATPYYLCASFEQLWLFLSGALNVLSCTIKDKPDFTGQKKTKISGVQTESEDKHSFFATDSTQGLCFMHTGFENESRRQHLRS